MCPLFTLGLADPYLARKAKQQTNKTEKQQQQKQKEAEACTMHKACKHSLCPVS